MLRRPISFEGRPLLDIASYARRGPGRRDRLSPAEIEHVSLTVHGAPEVMVKVLTRGGQNLGAVRKHFEYLNRKGALDIETDDGQRLDGKGVERDLIDDWDLDVEEDRRRSSLDARPGRPPPKLVHKVLFSMPPGTPSQKVLEAVKRFAREEFAFKHRYAMVLHTDEPHPHVHMVIRAVSDQGERLNIRKSTLRLWRSEFAWHMRALGIAANATERAVRGNTSAPVRGAIYRVAQRGESRLLDRRMQHVPHVGISERDREAQGKSTLVETRKSVFSGWAAVSKLLRLQGRAELAARAKIFSAAMRTPLISIERAGRQLDRVRSPSWDDRSPPSH